MLPSGNLNISTQKETMLGTFAVTLWVCNLATSAACAPELYAAQFTRRDVCEEVAHDIATDAMKQYPQLYVHPTCALASEG
jgi:hypothetical protein